MNFILSLGFLITIYWQYQIFQKNEGLITELQQNLIHQEAIKLNLRQALTLNFFEEKEMLKSVDKIYKFPRALKFCSLDDDDADRTELSFFANRDFIEVNQAGVVLREGQYFANDESLILLSNRHFDLYSHIQKIVIYDHDQEGLPLSLNDYHVRDEPCFSQKNPSPSL